MLDRSLFCCCAGVAGFCCVVVFWQSDHLVDRCGNTVPDARLGADRVDGAKFPRYAEAAGTRACVIQVWHPLSDPAAGC